MPFLSFMFCTCSGGRCEKIKAHLNGVFFSSGIKPLSFTLPLAL